MLLRPFFTSAQTFPNFHLDHMIIIFITYSRPVSFKFMFQMSGDTTLTSHLGHLTSNSSMLRPDCARWPLDFFLNVSPIVNFPSESLALLLCFRLYLLFFSSCMYSPSSLFFPTLVFCYTRRSYFSDFLVFSKSVFVFHSLGLHDKPFSWFRFFFVIFPDSFNRRLMFL